MFVVNISLQRKDCLGRCKCKYMQYNMQYITIKYNMRMMQMQMQAPQKRTGSQMWPKKRRGAASQLKKFGNPLIGHCRPPHCDVIVKSSTYVVWNGL